MPPNFALNNNSNAKKYARDYSRWLKWTGWMVLYESLIFGFVWLVWYGYADQSKHTEYRDDSYNWGKTPTTAFKRQCMVWWWLEVQMEGTKQATLWISFFCCCSNVAFIALSQLFIYIYIREVTIEHCKQTSDQQKMKKKRSTHFPIPKSAIWSFARVVCSRHTHIAMLVVRTKLCALRMTFVMCKSRLRAQHVRNAWTRASALQILPLAQNETYGGMKWTRK